MELLTAENLLLALQLAALAASSLGIISHNYLSKNSCASTMLLLCLFASFVWIGISGNAAIFWAFAPVYVMGQLLLLEERWNYLELRRRS